MELSIERKGDPLRKLRLSFTLLLITILFGVVSYHYIEGMGLFDAFYMTMITISTVGFGEVKPLSTYGRIITIIIISTGITIGAYTIGNLLRMFIEGELIKTFGRRKVERQISGLKNHFIICGYGRIGSFICEELLQHKRDFVVIESDEHALEKLEKKQILFLNADASSEESLMRAGIMQAQAIATALRSDADNVFVSLTARGLRPDIFILARASDASNEGKLHRAGATRVVSPYLLGGKRMAHVLIRPTVVDFIDIAVMENNLGLIMEEFRITENSYVVGKNLIESNLRRDFGVIIVLIKKFNGEMIFNPQPQVILEGHDVLVVLGMHEEMKKMLEVF